MNRGAFKQYNQVQIKTANRGKLIVMLYQGAIRFMKKAMLFLEQNDIEGKGNALIRAQDIILELTYALDQKLLDQGDELALNLQRLYLYSYRRLVHANVHMETEPIEEVIKLMENLLGAWEQIIQGNSGGPGGGEGVNVTAGLALTG
jgi:flagellar secretion chaperone FliS